MSNLVVIRGLEAHARVGVTEAERAAPQRLLLDVEMETEGDFAAMGDDIRRTADYDRISRELAALAEERPRRLIETLCAECVRHILDNHPVRRARVRARKFILPSVEFVAVEYEASKTKPHPHHENPVRTKSDHPLPRGQHHGRRARPQ